MPGKISGTELRRQYSALAFTAFFVACLTVQAKPPQTPPLDPTPPLVHDSHQGFDVAVNPYVSAEPSRTKFGKHTPYDGGFLAIDAYFRNDNDLPVRINLRTVELRIGSPGQQRQRLDPVAPEDVADGTLLKKPRDPRLPRVGVTLPGSVPKSGRSKEWQEFADVLRSAEMSTEVIPPHGTAHGVFYFDINNQFGLVSGASFVVSDLQFMTSKQGLLFFEVDLKNASH